MSRAHRIGQTETVNIYRCVMEEYGDRRGGGRGGCSKLVDYNIIMPSAPPHPFHPLPCNPCAYRLLTSGSVEEDILERAKKKMVCTMCGIQLYVWISDGSVGGDASLLGLRGCVPLIKSKSSICCLSPEFTVPEPLF